MAVIAGIDEAGLGPVVGPLVVAAVAFEVPDELVDVSLWTQLSGTVTRRPVAGRRTLAIDDSKKLYSPPNGLQTLERSVLSAVSALGPAPRGLAELLGTVAPHSAAAASRCPWYSGCALDLPRHAPREDVLHLAAALRRRGARSGIRLLGVRAEVVYAEDLNRDLTAGRTKAEVNLDRVLRHLRWIRAVDPTQRLVVHLDRQGGRTRYLGALTEAFDGAFVWILDESRLSSRYRIEDAGRTVDLSVRVGCDAHQLPTALASMTAKYLRELFMALLNRYFSRIVPDLRPTAGYPMDGYRWIREVSPHLAGAGLDPERIFRQR